MRWQAAFYRDGPRLIVPATARIDTNIKPAGRSQRARFFWTRIARMITKR